MTDHRLLKKKARGMARRTGIPYSMALQQLRDQADADADASDQEALAIALEEVLTDYLGCLEDDRDADTQDLAENLARRALAVMTAVPEEEPAPRKANGS